MKGTTFLSIVYLCNVEVFGDCCDIKQETQCGIGYGDGGAQSDYNIGEIVLSSVGTQIPLVCNYFED